MRDQWATRRDPQPAWTWGKTFLTFFVLMVTIGLCCGWCAQGIDPPSPNTPTPTGVTP